MADEMTPEDERRAPKGQKICFEGKYALQLNELIARTAISTTLKDET